MILKSIQIQMCQPKLTRLIFVMSLAALANLAIAFNSVADPAVTLEGRWAAPGEKPGEVDFVVRLERVNANSENLYRGIMESFKLRPGEDPKCIKCKGDKKDRPLQGIEIVSGLKFSAKSNSGESVYLDGKFLDTDSGSEYRSKAVMSADGKKLMVTGYFAFFSQTQEWTRLPTR